MKKIERAIVLSLLIPTVLSVLVVASAWARDFDDHINLRSGSQLRVDGTKVIDQSRKAFFGSGSESLSDTLNVAGVQRIRSSGSGVFLVIDREAATTDGDRLQPGVFRFQGTYDSDTSVGLTSTAVAADVQHFISSAANVTLVNRLLLTIGGAERWSVNNSGYMGVNVGSVNPAYLIEAVESNTAATSGSLGPRASVTYNPAADNSAVVVRGWWGRALGAGSSQLTGAAPGTLRGVQGSAEYNGTSTCTAIAGVTGVAQVTAAGTASTATSIYAFNPTATGGGVAVTKIGMQIENITGGTTNNWAIYSAGGNSVHAGKLNVGSTAAPTSTLHTVGSFATPYAAKSASYTLTATDYTVTFDASGAARTATLPTAVGITGRIYVVKKTDSSGNAVTVDGDGAETIDGATTVTLSTQYAGRVIQSDGANWQVIGSF